MEYWDHNINVHAIFTVVSKFYMWVCVLAALFSLGLIFHALAKFYYNFYELYETTHHVSLASSACYSKIKFHTSYHDLKVRTERRFSRPRGLYIFGELLNSVLYSYGMMLLVSLPRFPSGWSLRMLTGWYSLYCSLVTVSYRASMTAILANPVPRITIDTLEELEASGISCGGWGDNTKQFFQTLSDKSLEKIAENFERVDDSDTAVFLVAQGRFAYYENSFFLKALAVKRQLQSKRERTTNNSDWMKDRQLHIMENCLINMPISIGLQKNSPLKPTMDKLIRRIIEAGFVKKWLDDIMQETLIAEIFEESAQATKALMNMRKLYGAFVVLFIGYFLSTLTAVIEILVWHFTVKKHPFYDKYSKQIRYPKGYSKQEFKKKKRYINFWKEKILFWKK